MTTPAITTTLAHGPNGQTAEFVFVTPSLAAQMLARNIKTNRNLKAGRVLGYERDIRNDEWLITGEAIKFDADDNLIDGQNRLTAIVRADKGAWLLVVRNLEKGAVVPLDSGATRTGADSIVMAGIAPKTTAKAIAAIAALHTRWKEGYVRNAGSSGGGKETMTKNELAQAVLSIPNIEMAARVAEPIYRVLRLPLGAVGTAYLAFTEIDPKAANEFFERIRKGIQLGPGDPFTTLARRIASDGAGGYTRRMHSGLALFYLFRTWNAWRTGESLSRFQIGSANAGFTPLPQLK